MKDINQQAIRPTAQDIEVMSKGKKARRSTFDKNRGCTTSIKTYTNKRTRRPIRSHTLVSFFDELTDPEDSSLHDDVILSTQTESAMYVMYAHVFNPSSTGRYSRGSIPK